MKSILAALLLVSTMAFAQADIYTQHADGPNPGGIAMKNADDKPVEPPPRGMPVRPPVGRPLPPPRPVGQPVPVPTSSQLDRDTYMALNVAENTLPTAYPKAQWRKTVGRLECDRIQNVRTGIERYACTLEP